MSNQRNARLLTALGIVAALGGFVWQGNINADNNSCRALGNVFGTLEEFSDEQCTKSTTGAWVIFGVGAISFIAGVAISNGNKDDEDTPTSE